MKKTGRDQGDFSKLLSEEEICRTVMAVKGSEAVQKGLARAMELTRKNGVEYSGWILEDTPGEYTVSAFKKGEAMMVIPDPKPANAIGNFHTHVFFKCKT